MAIEHVLAETCDPRAEGLPAYFNALQDTFQCNGMSELSVTLRILTGLVSVVTNCLLGRNNLFPARRLFEQGFH